MQKRCRQFFEFAAGTRVLLVSFVGVMLMALLVFPMLPLGGDMIDLKLNYALSDIQRSMLQYGESGRTVYAIASPTLDTLFPALYVTFFCGLLYRFRPSERLWPTAFIPLVAGVWDLCENAQITALLLQYPNVSASQVAVASFFTTTKHVMSAVYELLAVVFLAVYLSRRLRSL
jgi:hypothetical protein